MRHDAACHPRVAVHPMLASVDSLLLVRAGTAEAGNRDRGRDTVGEQARGDGSRALKHGKERRARVHV